MEQRNIQLLKREFRFGEQGYTLVKTMMFVYSFKKANIDYPLYEESFRQPSVYLKTLCNIANENLLKIDNSCGKELGILIRDCIVSFNEYVHSQSGMGTALLALNELTIEGIEYFIKNEANFSGSKEDLSTPDTLMDLDPEKLASFLIKYSIPSIVNSFKANKAVPIPD